MKRNLMLLDIALLALVCLLGWYLWQKRNDERQQERRIRMAAVQTPAVPQPPPLKKVPLIDANSYADVAVKNLFSADRNPSPIPDPPPPPPPAPKMPPVPTAHGVMLWEGLPPTVVLSAGNAQQKGYHPGDKIGEFTLVSVDNKEIVFDWNGKEVSKRLDEIMEKNLVAASEPTPAPAKSASPAAALEPVKSLTADSSKGPGPDVGGGIHTCTAGDSSPPGTIVDGLQKKVNTTPFGVTCRWESVK